MSQILTECLKFPEPWQWGAQFFAGWVLIMTLYTTFFLPETKGVQLVRQKMLCRAPPFDIPPLMTVPMCLRSAARQGGRGWG